MAAEWIALALVLVTSAALSRSRPDRRVTLVGLTDPSDESGRPKFERGLKVLGRARLLGIVAGIVVAPTLYGLISRSGQAVTVTVTWALYGCAVAAALIVVLFEWKRIAPRAVEIENGDRNERVGVATIRPWFMTGTAAANGSLVLCLAALARGGGLPSAQDRAGHLNACVGLSASLGQVLWPAAMAAVAFAVGIWISGSGSSDDPTHAARPSAGTDSLLMLARQLCLGSITAALWLQAGLFLLATNFPALAGCSPAGQSAQYLALGASLSCVLVAVVMTWRYVVRWRQLAVLVRPTRPSHFVVP